MKNYKILYKETNIHHFIVPANSKKEAVQHVKDRIYWDLDPIDETSDSWNVKKVKLLKRLPINLKDKNSFIWWEGVKQSRKNWLEGKKQ